ncbi:protein phosphatase Slingshot homolog 2b isoform X2 [Eucyclogobius newberryi]|uniref:protein phosphatase Slingshot homolog 2b isoform X2 n=1 Tax=Eucyclogobius newberryi TaxID=166745 RepID=UPI003B5C7D32
MALVTVQRSPTPSTSSSPCVSESGSGEDDRRSQPRSISESFLTVKGAALFLPRGNGSSPSAGSRFTQLRSKHAGDIQQHLQTMFTLLRPEDNIKLAVRLESVHSQITRYMVVVTTNGRQDTEESVVLGMDISPVDSSCSVGMVLPLWSDTLIHLDGDGGFSVSTDNKIHVFKPVSVQAMWSALQSLHKACEAARGHNYFPGSLFLTWVSYYQSRVCSDQARINEWNAMQDVESHRADSPVLFSDVPTERERTERQIKTSLREIMMQKDLENVTSKEIRTELEMSMTCNLREFKEFIDNEMIIILRQMDSPTEIFDHVFLGSEWNASNLEELQNSGVQCILNVTREIDNFFPGLFEYHNIRVYDEEATDLLAYWNDTYKFIARAKKAGSKCLVHCKMGISRSAATVIAYAMKEYGWDLNKAFDYVKERRTVTKPNPSFMRQLEEYQGILVASKQRHNKLWRSHSDSDLSEHHEPLSKSLAQPNSLGRSDPHNQIPSSGPSVKELLDSLGAPSVKPSSSQSDPKSKQSSSSTEGLMSLSAQSLEDQPQAHSRGSSPYPPSPPLSNGISDSDECPSTPPLPRAATVMPPSAGVSMVAQCVPLGQPHPPPLPHHLPPSPTPSPTPLCVDEFVKAQVVLCPVVKPLPVSVPQPFAIRAPASQLGTKCVSAAVPVQNIDCEQHLCALSLTAHTPPSSFISYPSAIPQDNEVLLAHSADHINFFTAREKFKGMTKDDKTAVKKEEQSVPPDVTSEEKDGVKKKEMTVSVQAAEPKLDLNVSKLKQEDILSQEETGDAKEEVKHKEEEEAAPQLYSDWSRGSVRRVTKQLEQRMRQEHEVPSPFSSPSSFSGGWTQRRTTSVPSAMGSSVQDVCPEVIVVSPVQEEQEEEDAEMHRLEQNDKSTKGAKVLPLEKSLSTSGHYTAHSPFSSVNFLCLEGVTEFESATDWDCPALGGDIIMRETWETLCELGAFLQQVSVGEACKVRQVARTRGSSIQRRVKEVEARIRQAGLTPPSLMKRSASLAKLGCLELLANELSEWELARSSVSPSSCTEPPEHTVLSDESKKQRVHHSPSLSSQHPHTPPPEARDVPPESSPSPSQPVPSGQDTPGPNPTTVRQQYGRTHPLRRLKKRTGTLYHTM